MIRILVLSDTHIPHRAPFLPPALNAPLQDADVIVHAGDFTSHDVWMELQAYDKPVYAVFGNMDDEHLVRTLPEVQRVTLEGVSLAITHGSGAKVGLEPRVLARIGQPLPHVVIYGHSHQFRIQPMAGTWLLNPGSPTDTVYAREQTYGWILLHPPRVTLRIYTLPDHTLRREHTFLLPGD